MMVGSTFTAKLTSADSILPLPYEANRKFVPCCPKPITASVARFSFSKTHMPGPVFSTMTPKTNCSAMPQATSFQLTLRLLSDISQQMPIRPNRPRNETARLPKLDRACWRRRSSMRPVTEPWEPAAAAGSTVFVAAVAAATARPESTGAAAVVSVAETVTAVESTLPARAAGENANTARLPITPSTM